MVLANNKYRYIMSVLIILMIFGRNSWAEEDSLAKKYQNSLGSLISVNFEYNYLEDVGPDDNGTDHVFNLKPVYPVEGDGSNWPDHLGSDKCSLGPTAAVIAMPGKWLFAALTHNAWDIASDSDEPDVNQFMFQYFINYNFDNG